MRSARATVAILGGGPAGASAALELAQLGIDAVLIEQTDGSGSSAGECLAPSANPLLHQLGLADVLQASGALPSYGNRSSWGGNGEVTDLDFLRDPFGHGWHLDRQAFNRALLAAVETAGVPIWRQTRVSTIERTSDSSPSRHPDPSGGTSSPSRHPDRSGGTSSPRRVSPDDPFPIDTQTPLQSTSTQHSSGYRIDTASPSGDRILHATMLVDATGRRALLARHARIRRRTFDSQVAAVAFLRPGDRADPLLDSTTIIEAAPNGWWYAALLPDRRLAVSWFTDPDLLAESAAWQPDGWWNQLQSSKLVGPLATTHGYGIPQHIDIFPAGSSLLTQPTGDGWIAAGDAAASYDPLSSHGIGSALASGRVAARAIAATLAGDLTAFPTYRDHLLASYTHYLYTRHAYYADERRWPTSPFWRRRHRATDPRSSRGESPNV